MSKDHNVEQAVPFFMVSDMDTSLRFYIDGVGFEMKNTGGRLSETACG